MWVEKMKNGKYNFVERYTDFLTGKKKRVSVVMDKNTAQTRKTAQRALDAKIDKALMIGASNEKPLTLGELVEAYRVDQERTVKQSTYKRNYFACNTLMNILGKDVLVNNLTAQYIRRSMLDTGKEPGTLNEHLTRLKSLLRWGYHNDFVKDITFLDKMEPFRDVPHRQKIQDKFLDSSELKLLLSKMDVKPWYLLTQLLALSGLRIGELAALTRKDVDFEERLIRVSKTYDFINKTTTPPKTFTSNRDVYMQDELYDLCKKVTIYMLRQRVRHGYGESNLFFQSTDGRHLHYYAYNKYLRETSQRILGRPLTVHALRHTHASLLMENGIDIDTIARRLGHDSSQVTREIYLHVTEKLKQRDNERISLVKIM